MVLHIAQTIKQSVCPAEGASSVVLRTEALSALCGLAKNYTAVLTLHWASISHAVAHNLQAKKSQSVEKSGSEPMEPRESCAVSCFCDEFALTCHIGTMCLAKLLF